MAGIQHEDIDHTGLTGVGTVATDSIWDAKGDLAVGTGANTAAKLTVGANDTIPMADSGQATGLKWVGSQTPTTQDYDDVAAEGTADTYARGDHLHGMPAAAGGGGDVPGWVAAFIGTTDSTNFFWDGNDLASFTAQTVTGSATWSEGQNLASALISNQTGDDAACQLIAQTFATGHAWTLAVQLPSLASDSGGANSSWRGLGIVFTDGTGTTANCVIGHIQQDNGAGGGSCILVGRHGTLTNVNVGAPWVSNAIGVANGWIYIRLIYQASNTFRLQFGDGVSFSAFGEADISKTMTPTHVGLFATMQNSGTMVATFGPLRKTA